MNTNLLPSGFRSWEANLTALLGWDRWPPMLYQPLHQNLSWWPVGVCLPPVGQRSLTHWIPKQGSMWPGPPSVTYTYSTLRPPWHGARLPRAGGDLWRNVQSRRSTPRRPQQHVPLSPAWSLELGCISLACHRKTGKPFPAHPLAHV